jgi:polyisoprenoid-binding protein YceI
MANNTQWHVDPAHSELQFKVKHLVISTVTGSLKVFKGSMTAGEDSFEDGRVDFDADINSLDTGNEQRDAHLKSPEFFDAATHPTLHFKSQSLTKKDGDHYTLSGNLTIREHTHPVTLDVELGGIAVDPYGQTKAGFEVSGKINRHDFGLTWSAVTEAGGVVVSDEVRIAGNIQFIKN